MMHILAGPCLFAALVGAMPTLAKASDCSGVSSPAAQQLCADILEDGSATGAQDTVALAAVLIQNEDIGARISEVGAGLCPTAPTTGIAGEDLAAVLNHLSRDDAILTANEVKLSRLTVLGTFQTPSRLPYTLTISDSVFCGNIDLRNTVFGGSLFLTSNLILAGSGETREGLIFAKNARIANDLKIQFSRFGGLIAPAIRVGGTLGVTESAFGHLSLADGQMSDLALARSRQSSEIYSRSRSWIDETYENSERFEGYPIPFFASNLDLWSTIIDDELYGDRLHLDGAITALGLKVDRLRFHFATLPGADFRDLIAQDVEIKASTLGKPSNRDTCAIDVAFRFTPEHFISFAGADIGDSFEINSKEGRPSTATGQLCLNDLRVSDTLDVSGLRAEVLDLSGTQADVRLALTSDFHGDTVFTGARQVLDLTGVSTPQLTISQDTRLPYDTRLSADIFDSLDFLEGRDHEDALVNGVILLTENLEAAKKDVALRIYADRLRDTGFTKAALALEFEREKAQTDALEWTANRVLREIAERLGGYGLRPNRTLWLAFVAVIFGAIVARSSLEGRYFLYRQIVPRLRRISTVQRRREAGRGWLIAWIWFDAVVLSFDRLIPIVTIADAHKKLRFRHQPWVRAYFTLHALLGLMLAATVITVIGQSIGLRAV